MERGESDEDEFHVLAGDVIRTATLPSSLGKLEGQLGSGTYHAPAILTKYFTMQAHSIVTFRIGACQGQPL